MTTASAADALPAIWPEPPPALNEAIQTALAANVSLQADRTDVDRAAARLAAARSLYFPRLDLVARYSMAAGGRTIDLPIGDLLNPVYNRLNDLTGTNEFATVDNASIPFLRPHEQETKLRLLQPLYRPEIVHGRRAAAAQLAATNAQIDVLRRDLTYQVQEAWFAQRRADAAVHIYESGLALVTESLRVDRALEESDKITPDVVLRAQAEVAAVRQQVESSRRDRELAQAYINFLLNRPLETPAEPIDTAVVQAYRDRLRAIDPDDLELSPEHREELRALDEAIHAARAATAAAESRRGPALSLAVEAGTQGTDYRLGPGYNYAQGSVVAELNLFDRGERRANVAVAQAEERRAELQRQDAANRIALELRQARDAFATARTAVDSAEERAAAARAAYKVVAAREKEGSASQLTVLDARNTLTSAELAVEVSTFDLCTAAARLARAAAFSPLP